jgi:hypothetical protein
MVTFEKIIIDKTIKNLLAGKDYREEVVNIINIEFFDFAIVFFKKILYAKMDAKAIDLTWYKENFINNEKFDPAESAIFAGVNKKTVTNIYGSAKKILF